MRVQITPTDTYKTYWIFDPVTDEIPVLEPGIYAIFPVKDTLEGDRDGETYERAFDYNALNAQAKRVFNIMKMGGWFSLAEVAYLTGDPEASVSARIRDFRKPKFGALTVHTRRHPGNQRLWLYQLEVPGGWSE